MASIYWKDKVLTLSDGVELVSRIWVPSQTDGPWPALLMRQPYGREIASTVTYAHPEWWASHGFLVVIQDVRGQGSSSGQFKGFIKEASDTSETHEWVRSLKDCNGLLGTYGFSYQGLTQLIAKPGTKPPECLAPAMTGLNEKEHWACDGNAFWWHLNIAWGLQLAAMKARRNNDSQTWELLRRSLEDGSYLRDGPSLLSKFDSEGMALKWLMNSEGENSLWQKYKPLDSWLKKPMLLIGGWWDPHLNGILDIYKKAKNVGGKPELHIGPATHLNWWKEVQKTQLIFFKKHLQGLKVQNEKKNNIHLWNISKGKWEDRNETNYESSCEHNSWNLIFNEGNLSDSRIGFLHPSKASKGVVNIVSDPWRPVPSIGGHLDKQPGLAERSSIDNRNDVAIFTSEPFSNDVCIEGIPLLCLKAESEQGSFDICVAISRVSANQETVEQLSTGFLRIRNTNNAKNSLREIHLQPLLASISKNESLRLSISGSAWPAIGINPGKADEPCGAPSSNCLVISIKMMLSGSNFRILPLLSR